MNSGEIAAVGRNVTGIKVGERVSGEGHITCGECPPCKLGKKHLCMNTVGLGVHRHGCFAEYFALPAENVFKIPQFVPDELASIFDPYGNAVHTALSFDLAGEDVLITGAGPIGIMAAAIAQKAGARHIVITDINDYRLDLAKSMGAPVRLMCPILFNRCHEKSRNSLWLYCGIRDVRQPTGFKYSIGNSTKWSQNRFAWHPAPGTAIDWDLVIFKMLTIKGIYGREIFGTWYKMTHLLESGLNLKPIITHSYPIAEFEKGFQTMISGKSG